MEWFRTSWQQAFKIWELFTITNFSGYAVLNDDLITCNTLSFEELITDAATVENAKEIDEQDEDDGLDNDVETSPTSTNATSFQWLSQLREVDGWMHLTSD